MKNLILEKIDDWYINLYESWLFIRSMEYSAMLLNEVLWYKLYLNIDKKTWFVFLELWFPKIIKDEVIHKINSMWYFIRVISKDNEITLFDWNDKILKDKNKLLELKNTMVKFE